MIVENRGRDILPFIEILRKIHDLKYKAICKIHSKKSVYRSDGDDIRDDLLKSLLGSQEDIGNIVNLFENDMTLGLVVPSDYLIKHSDHNMTFDQEIVHWIAKKINIDFQYSVFPAGSMFWFRQASLSRLLILNGSLFPPEEGLADGTIAHGVERVFSVAAAGIGYRTLALPSN
jgi:lipopolysaccharide biosynthesis protein